MPSEKLPVIERIWQQLQEEGSGRRIVFFEDVVDAITYCNEHHGTGLSAKNPANFMKDLVRSDKASANWPASLCALRVGARQRVGGNRVFEFLDYAEGQSEPFPNRYMPDPDLELIPLQSLTMPLASKSLGRKDESWLIQVAVALSVVEQHFATRSMLNVVELVHLQTGVKLANSEIDAVFRAVVQANSGDRSHILITCEAKQEGERILDHQIAEQVQAAQRSIEKSVYRLDLQVSYIVPIAIKAIPPNGDIYVAEFEPWSPSEAGEDEALLKDIRLTSEGLYRLCPPVPGIGFRAKAGRRKSPEAA